MSNVFKLVSFLLRSTGQLRLSRYSVTLVFPAVAVAGLANTGLLALIKTVLSESETETAGIGWAFLGLCIVFPCARFTAEFLLVRLSHGTSFALRMRLAGQILRTPLRDLEKLGAPRLLASLTDDVNSITIALTYVPIFFFHVMTVVSCLGYLFWLSWKLGLAVAAAIVVGIASFQIPVARAIRHIGLGREQWNVLFKHFRGLTEGIKELKAHRFRRRTFVSQLLEATAESMRRHNVAGGTIYVLANVWGNLLFFIAIGAIMFIFPRFMAIDRGVTLGYSLGILFLLSPLDVILNMLPTLGRASVAVGKVEELGVSLAREAGRELNETAALDNPHWQKIELVGVAHTYYQQGSDAPFSLGPVDLVLTPGELVFVVGGNGSGKTTLVKLLTGLYRPETGEVRIDGNPVGDEWDPYRERFSVVFSDFYLFEELLGLDTSEIDAKARDFLAQLRLDQKVRVEGGVLSSIELSQGQRKRLALLTAFLEDRQIYVFDEWAADQDPEFKEVFYFQLLPELVRRGKTVVVITHDDRYFHVADRIVKLDYGRIECDGSVGEYFEAYGFDSGQGSPRARAGAA